MEYNVCMHKCHIMLLSTLWLQSTKVTWHEKIGLMCTNTPLHIILIISLSVQAIQVLYLTLNIPLFAALLPKVSLISYV